MVANLSLATIWPLISAKTLKVPLAKRQARLLCTQQLEGIAAKFIPLWHMIVADML
jgi:hypothetical protein